MADNRSQKLVSRVFRNLSRHGITINEILDEEIYEELTKLQDRIIARVNPDKLITLTLATDIDEYALTTEDASADPDATTYKNNVASIKVVRQPDTFLYPFQVVSNVEYAKLIDGEDITWTGLASLIAGIQFSSYIKTGVDMLGTKNGSNLVFTIPEEITADSEEIFFNGVLQVRDTDYSIVNSTVTFTHTGLPAPLAPASDDTLICNYIIYSAFGNAVVNTHQPLIGTIIKNRLHVYPIPDSDFDGETIDLIVYQKSGQGSVSVTVEPELDNEWDKALEYGVTAEYLEGKSRDEYKGYYEKEFEDIKHTIPMKRGTIERASVYEGRKNERNWY
jgi:hypothetical protein